MAKKPKRPTYIEPVLAVKSVRAAHEPESFDRQTPLWQFHRCDMDHGTWGWSTLDSSEFLKVLQFLRGIETMTWAEIMRAAGGRSHGNNHHSIPVDGLCKEARQRLIELQLDEFDEVFSLRVDARKRIFGIRDGRVLRIIWHDPNHSVCPVRS